MRRIIFNFQGNDLNQKQSWKPKDATWTTGAALQQQHQIRKESVFQAGAPWKVPATEVKETTRQLITRREKPPVDHVLMKEKMAATAMDDIGAYVQERI